MAQTEVHPEERPTISPRASLFLRLLAGEHVPPDTRDFETKYLHLVGVLPFILVGTAFFAGLIGYLIGTV